MSSYRTRRRKLKEHTAGRDRHSKPVARVSKEERQRVEHARALTERHRPAGEDTET